MKRKHEEEEGKEDAENTQPSKRKDTPEGMLSSSSSSASESSSSFPISVSSFSRELHSILVEDGWTVKRLKDAVTHVGLAPPEAQCLIFEDRQLWEDDWTLGAYGLFEGAIIHFFLKTGRCGARCIPRGPSDGNL